MAKKVLRKESKKVTKKTEEAFKFTPEHSRVQHEASKNETPPPVEVSERDVLTDITGVTEAISQQPEEGQNNPVLESEQPEEATPEASPSAEETPEEKEERRGRPKGSRNRKKITEIEDKENIIAVGVNTLLIAPIAQFFVNDVSKAMLNEQHSKFLNMLMPDEEVKPSWTAFSIVLALCTASSIGNAILTERKLKKETDLNSNSELSDEQLVGVIARLSERQKGELIKQVLQIKEEMEVKAKQAGNVNPSA